METNQHYAIYERLQDEFVVLVDHTIIATSNEVIQLDEFHPKYIFNPVYYFPMDGIDEQYLRSNSQTSFCPIKGEASYWDIVVGQKIIEQAVWSYEKTLETALPIQNRMAFDLDKDVKLLKNDIRISKQGFSRKK